MRNHSIAVGFDFVIGGIDDMNFAIIAGLVVAVLAYVLLHVLEAAVERIDCDCCLLSLVLAMVPLVACCIVIPLFVTCLPCHSVQSWKNVFS